MMHYSFLNNIPLKLERLSIFPSFSNIKTNFLQKSFLYSSLQWVCEIVINL